MERTTAIDTAILTRIGRAPDSDEAQFVQDLHCSKDPNLLKDGVRHLVFDNDASFAPSHVQDVGREGVRVEVGSGVCDGRGKVHGDEGEAEQIELKTELKVSAGGPGSREREEGGGKGGGGGGGGMDARLQRIARILQLGF